MLKLTQILFKDEIDWKELGYSDKTGTSENIMEYDWASIMQVSIRRTKR